MPPYTQEWLNEQLTKNPALARRNQHLTAGGERSWKPTVIQKLEDDSGPAPDKAAPVEGHTIHRDEQPDKEMDDDRPEKFGVTITMRVSDNLRRDLDGMCSTVLDALISARRRLLAVHSKTHGKDRTSKQRG